MDGSNFTEKGKDSIRVASNIAIQNKNSEIDIWHMIFALCANDNDMACQLLKKMEM